MQAVVLVVHILAAVGLVAFVLLQQGKGAEMGAAFGSGASATVFGATGSASFLSRTTAILATIFFITSLSLAYFSGNSKHNDSVVTSIPAIESAIEQKKSEDLPVVPQSAVTVESSPTSGDTGSAEAVAPAPVVEEKPVTDVPADNSMPPALPSN
jgi:preprotein translocase subunit SecG